MAGNSDSAMYISEATINPSATMQDNTDLNGFFSDIPAASNPPTWSGMDQFLDLNGGNEFPFPQAQDRPQPTSFGIAPQAVNPYMAGMPRQNGMMAMPTHAHGLPVSTHGFMRQTAAPSALMDATATGYITRQAAGSTQQKRTHDSAESNEVSPETPEKKPRKQRKKRNKHLSEAEANEKRQKFLDRNKVAAHKCRQRKKEWTDNLQTKASEYQHNNDFLRMQINDCYELIEAMRTELTRIHGPNSVHIPGCSPSATEQAWNAFLKREASGFADVANNHLREIVETRNGNNVENDPTDGLDMSRNTSMQSTPSGGYDQLGRTERHDSGVSVSADTPEDVSKTQNTPKLSVDEGVDLENGQNFPGSMMPNQRLGMWQNGPVDLLDPSVYLGLSN